MGEIVLQRAPELDVFQNPDIVMLDQKYPAFPRWINAEAIEGVALERHQARDEAAAIYEQRMQHLREGEYSLVPQEVDPLTNAARVLQAEKDFGVASVAYREARQSLLVDSQRLLGEAWRRGAWEYFPPLAQPYSEAKQSYTFMGRSLLEMVADGINPTIAQPEERLNRTGEFVEEVTYAAIRRLGRTALAESRAEQPLQEIPPTASVITISECSDWAIEAYETGERNKLGGYVPEIKKLMIRGVRYDHKDDERYQEQMAVPGLFITHDVVVEALQRLQVIPEETAPSKEDIRATQAIDPDGKGVLNTLRMLDQVASELSGKNIFIGEEVEPDHSKDYDAIPAQALLRQEELAASSETLTDHLIELERQGTDHFAARGLVEKFAHDLLFQKVAHDPVQAAIVFDTQTAQLIEQSLEQREAGNDWLARQMLLQAKELAPALAFCGVGSECGLEKVNNYSAEAIKAVRLGLKVDADEEIFRDTKRECSKCHKKEIYYASLSARKVCFSCGKKDTAGKARHGTSAAVQKDFALAA